MELKGRVALVTGGAGGIGGAVVRVWPRPGSVRLPSTIVDHRKKPKSLPQNWNEVE